MEVVVVVVAFCGCVVLTEDILDMVMPEMKVETWIVSYNVYRTAAHGILSC